MGLAPVRYVSASHRSRPRGGAREGSRRRACRPGPALGLAIVVAPLSAGAQRPAPEVPGTVLDAAPRELAWFNNHCVPLADLYVPEVKRICHVNVFRPLGAVGERKGYFALYRRLVIVPGDQQAGSAVDRPPFSNTAVVIFEETPEPGKVRPILADANEGTLGNEWFVAPRIIERDGKQLLVISRELYRARADEQYYAVENGAWVPVEKPK